MTNLVILTIGESNISQIYKTDMRVASYCTIVFIVNWHVCIRGGELITIKVCIEPLILPMLSAIHNLQMQML